MAVISPVDTTSPDLATENDLLMQFRKEDSNLTVFKYPTH